MDEESELLHALYVEDNAQDADLASRALRRGTPPIELDVAVTVSEARERLRGNRHYEWVLFDLTLPDGDGLEVLKQLRQQRSRSIAVAVTGTGDERAVIRALKMGVDDYVIKQADYLERLHAMLWTTRERVRSTAVPFEHPVRVLYVEDSTQDGELAVRHLSTHAPHLQVELVHEPLTAIEERWREQAVDVLLLDYQLSDDLDAFAVIKQMQSGPCCHLPIVVVTGQGSEDIAVQALRMGVSDYVIKDAGYLQRLPAVLEAAYMRSRVREREAELRRIMQQVPGAIVVYQVVGASAGRAEVGDAHAPGDPAARESALELEPLYANPSLRTVQGLHLHELAHGAMWARVHPEDRVSFQQTARQAMLRGRVVSGEYRFDVPGQGWRWLETQMTPEPLSDGSIRLYTYTFDVTQRREFAELAVAAAAAERANRAKTEFLSRMSHELRTPLNAILGFAQLLQSDPSAPVNDKQRRQLGHIEQAGAHLVEMINEVLDLARIESGHMLFALTPVEAEQTCAQAIGLVMPMARERMVHIGLDVRPATLTVLADPLRLRQVLVNLLSNAVKYNRPQGRVDVELSQVADRVVFRVTDTGQGMTVQQQSHLFEPFNRLGAEHTSVEGAGIGLVIVRKLVELMGGRLSVSSQLGVGSCFEVSLPCVEPGTMVAEPAPARVAAPAAKRVRHYTVLYVEDNDLNVELMRQILHGQTHLTLVVATSGAQAIRMALQDPPDLLLLDMQLGDMDGVAVSNALRDDPRVRDVPRIGLSAEALPEHVRYAQSQGFADYLTKPFNVPELMACLERYLPR